MAVRSFVIMALALSSSASAGLLGDLLGNESSDTVTRSFGPGADATGTPIVATGTPTGRPGDGFGGRRGGRRTRTGGILPTGATDSELPIQTPGNDFQGEDFDFDNASGAIPTFVATPGAGFGNPGNDDDSGSFPTIVPTAGDDLGNFPTGSAPGTIVTRTIPGGRFGNLPGNEGGSTPTSIPSSGDDTGNDDSDDGAAAPDNTTTAVPTAGNGSDNSDGGDDDQNDFPNNESVIPTFVATPGVPFGSASASASGASVTASGFLTRKRAAPTKA